MTGALASVELPAVADPDNGGTAAHPRYEYGYDERGNQVLIRDPLGRETRFTFDVEGRQLTRTLPLGFGPDRPYGAGSPAARNEPNAADGLMHTTHG